jgi:FkbM family methyltransferase
MKIKYFFARQYFQADYDARLIVRRAIIASVTRILGTTPRLRRVLAGPIRGRRLCIAPQISLRMLLGIDEPWAMGTAQAVIQPGSVAYDIGAHVGYTALVLAQATLPAGQVHAFELHPATIHLLRRTVDANPDLPIRVHPVGLADRAMNVRLDIGPSFMTHLGGLSETGGLCRVESLDDYAGKHQLAPPNFIKMDIEGAEVDCLVGARQLLTQYKPILLIEFHGRHKLDQGMALLREFRYTKFTSADPSALTGSGTFHASVLCE